MANEEAETGRLNEGEAGRIRPQSRLSSPLSPLLVSSTPILDALLLADKERRVLLARCLLACKSARNGHTTTRRHGGFEAEAVTRRGDLSDCGKFRGALQPSNFLSLQGPAFFAQEEM